MNDDRRYAIAVYVVSWAALLFTIWFVVDIIQIIRNSNRIALSWEMIAAMWTFLFSGVIVLAQPTVRKVEKTKEQETTYEIEVTSDAMDSETEN